MVATRQREPHRYFMCCLRTFRAFLSVIIRLNPYDSYTILLCIMSNEILPYHTIGDTYINYTASNIAQKYTPCVSSVPAHSSSCSSCSSCS